MFGRNKQGRDPEIPADAVTLSVAPGADFSGVTTVELCDLGIVRGELEVFLLLGEDFGGEVAGPNVVLGPPGSASAKARLDAELSHAVRRGATIEFRSRIIYGDGKSRIPQRIVFDLGPLGTRVLHLWGE